ncbi:MAG: carboxypeptidase regulatory-like domain-containing protein [Nitrospinae bacterium]|nr:carboxypeptidase regulatory-like domain-containing protein [Nitrospinota bacterium]
MAKYVLAIVAIISMFISTVRAEEAAYVIRGKVLEMGTRKPLVGISVFVADRRDEGVVTESGGGFRIPAKAAGAYRVMAEGIGYLSAEPQEVKATPADSAEAATIYIEPAPTLADIVVHADRNPDRVAKTVITGKELTKIPGSAGDPLRGMQALPGITTTSDQSGNPAIRGSGPNDNLYYVDFIPVYYLFHMGGMVSVFNADLVDDFNIYSSAFGPEFGDVTGAVIDVKLRDPRTDRLGVKASMSMLEADILAEGPVNEKQSFYVSARRSYIDLFMPATGSLGDSGVEYRQFPQYQDYQGKYLWKASDDQQASFQFSGANDRMKLNIPADSDIAKNDPLLAGDIVSEQNYDMQGVVVSSRLSPSVNNRLGISYMNTAMVSSLEQLGHAVVDINNFTLRDQVSIHAGENHELIFEGEYENLGVKLNIDVPKSLPSDFDPDTDFTSADRAANGETIYATGAAVSAKDRWRASEALTLIGGARATYGSYFDKFTIEPRLGAEYQLFRETLVTAGWGKYHQFPMGYEVARNIGNPDLGYVGAEHYVLGVEQGFDYGYTAKVEGYYKKLYDIIVPHAPENYLNGGSGTAYGAELLLKKSPAGDEWSGWVSLSRAATQRTNDLTGKSFPYNADQPVIVNLVYSWHVTERWTFGAKWRYQSGAPFTPIVGTYTDATGRTRPTYGDIGSERLPDYHRLDLRLDRDYVFNTWKMGFFFEIINAYGRENVSGYQYNAAYTSRKPVKQLPFLPSLGVQAEF